MSLTVSDLKRLVALIPAEHDLKELVFAEVSGFEEGIAIHPGRDGRIVVGGAHRGQEGIFLDGVGVVDQRLCVEERVR